MEKTKLLTLAVIGLLLLNLGTLAYLVLHRPEPQPLPHHPHPMHGPPPHMRPGRIIISTLKLDEKQQEQFEELKHEHRQRTLELEEERRQLQHRLFSLLRIQKPDMDSVDALTARVAGVQRQLVQHNFNHFQDIRGLLRPEQLPKYEQLTEQMADFFGPPPHPKRRP